MLWKLCADLTFLVNKKRFYAPDSWLVNALWFSKFRFEFRDTEVTNHNQRIYKSVDPEKDWNMSLNSKVFDVTRSVFDVGQKKLDSLKDSILTHRFFPMQIHFR